MHALIVFLVQLFAVFSLLFAIGILFVGVALIVMGVFSFARFKATDSQE